MRPNWSASLKLNISLKSVASLVLALLASQTMASAQPASTKAASTKAASPKLVNTKSSNPQATSSTKAAAKLALLSRKYTGEDLFGLTKKELLKRFPSPDFKHNADFSQVTWHGTDTSSVLELRFKDKKVEQVRLSTHYGYPRPGTTSDVELGQWLTKK